ncbi:sigma-70 family RNA polymerase sigma factor [Euzebya rosea]|uniref:sigma-70 family RNA polymerase sigma factor n=1 Tax=Euzebya rosea TaxID=2052804 RepID=UPI000D3E0EC1|nr:sigma-70 family RNA polymerase sigma factor [Euzebya rosea]
MLSASAFHTVATSVAQPGLRPVDPEVVRLVEEAQGGSSAAFAALYDRYVDRVYAFVYRRVGDRHLAEDLTGDVFTRALRRIDTYRYTGADPIAWLLTIARNRVHDHYKSARFRLEQAQPDAGVTEIDLSSAPERDAERAAVVAEVQAALTKLKPDHAEVLHLRFVEDLSVAEAAEILGRRVGAVRALQHRALKALATLVDVEAVAG